MCCLVRMKANSRINITMNSSERNRFDAALAIAADRHKTHDSIDSGGVESGLDTAGQRRCQMAVTIEVLTIRRVYHLVHERRGKSDSPFVTAMPPG